MSFLYAVVCVVEGTGLMLEKRWAEYFTVTLTSLGCRGRLRVDQRYSRYKVGLMVINVVVLIYLVWILKKRREGWGRKHGGEGEG